MDTTGETGYAVIVQSDNRKRLYSVNKFTGEMTAVRSQNDQGTAQRGAGAAFKIINGTGYLCFCK